MIEYIDLTKKAEVDLRKDDFISLQLEAMGESIRESLPKRQGHACLHEMQGVVFQYVSNQLDQQMAQPMAQQMTPQMGQQMGHQMGVPPCSNSRTISWRQGTGICCMQISRYVQFFFVGACPAK